MQSVKQNSCQGQYNIYIGKLDTVARTTSYFASGGLNSKIKFKQ